MKIFWHEYSDAKMAKNHMNILFNMFLRDFTLTFSSALVYPLLHSAKLIGRRFPQSDGLLYIKRT